VIGVLISKTSPVYLCLATTSSGRSRFPFERFSAPLSHESLSKGIDPYSAPLLSAPESNNAAQLFRSGNSYLANSLSFHNRNDGLSATRSAL
jgi:hypothetical protein